MMDSLYSDLLKQAFLHHDVEHNRKENLIDGLSQGLEADIHAHVNDGVVSVDTSGTRIGLAAAGFFVLKAVMGAIDDIKDKDARQDFKKAYISAILGVLANTVEDEMGERL